MDWAAEDSAELTYKDQCSKHNVLIPPPARPVGISGEVPFLFQILGGIFSESVNLSSSQENEFN